MAGRWMRERLVLAPAIAVVLAGDCGRWAVHGCAASVRRLQSTAAVTRARARVARLPPGWALPLFVVPELCSRAGWVVSAWLLLQGRPATALSVYAASKLFAGALAVWVYDACRASLLTIGWFAAADTWLRQRLLAMRAGVPRRRWPALGRARVILGRALPQPDSTR